MSRLIDIHDFVICLCCEYASKTKTEKNTSFKAYYMYHHACRRHSRINSKLSL